MDVSAAHSGLDKMKAYATGKPIEELAREQGLTDIIKLASNENPLGCSAKALEAVRSFAAEDMARYPDGGGYALKKALCEFHKAYGLSPEQITLGNGSNDLLDLIARTFAAPTDSIVFSEYAFAVYMLVTQVIGAKAVAAKASNYAHDLNNMLAAVTDSTKVVFIANPNNPTGTLLEFEALKAFVQKVPSNVLVVIDEAYTEYCTLEYTALDLLADHDNVVVVRTFSKAYGLAGLRVGYSVSSPAVASLVNRVRHPFNVNQAAMRAAEAALADTDFVEHTKALNLEQRTFLNQKLKALGLSCLESHTNFITFELPKLYSGSGADAYEALLAKGVIVRPLAGYKMPRHLRVSVGLPEENLKFVEALSQLLDGCL